MLKLVSQLLAFLYRWNCPTCSSLNSYFSDRFRSQNCGGRRSRILRLPANFQPNRRRWPNVANLAHGDRCIRAWSKRKLTASWHDSGQNQLDQSSRVVHSIVKTRSFQRTDSCRGSLETCKRCLTSTTLASTRTLATPR